MGYGPPSHVVDNDRSGADKDKGISSKKLGSILFQIQAPGLFSTVKTIKMGTSYDSLREIFYDTELGSNLIATNWPGKLNPVFSFGSIPRGQL